MSEARITKLEDSVKAMELSFVELKTTLKSIDENLQKFIETNNDVITFREKHKVTEARLIKLEEWHAKNTENINSVNLKIAVATWLWSALVFFAQKFL